MCHGGNEEGAETGERRTGRRMVTLAQCSLAYPQGGRNDGSRTSLGLAGIALFGRLLLCLGAVLYPGM